MSKSFLSHEVHSFEAHQLYTVAEGAMLTVLGCNLVWNAILTVLPPTLCCMHPKPLSNSSVDAPSFVSTLLDRPNYFTRL